MTPDETFARTVDALVRDIADFPKPGVVYKDITPLLADPTAFQMVIDRFVEAVRTSDAPEVDAVVGMEARGFIFAAPVALALGCAFVPVRKPGKLPARTEAISYDLEYGSETLEMHVDAISEGDRVLIVDDVLATGGTARATAELVRRCGGVVVGLSVLLELSFLNGRNAIGDVALTALRTL